MIVFLPKRNCESLNHLSFAKAKQWRTGELNPCSSGLWAQRDYRDTRPRYTFTIAFLAGSKLLKASSEDRIRTHIISFKGRCPAVRRLRIGFLAWKVIVAFQDGCKLLVKKQGKEQGWT